MVLIESLLFALIILFPFYLFLSYMDSSKKKQKALVDKAIEKGNVVNAIKIKQSALYSDNSYRGRFKYRAVYEYKVKNKKYKFVFWSSNPPLELTLYYLKNPRTANLPGAMSSGKINWLKVYLITAAVLYFLSV